MPGDFPLALYNEIHSRITPLHAKQDDAFRHYGGAWNAIAFRYKAAAEADGAYRKSIAKPVDSLQRYTQEINLFSFFTNAVAVLDSLSYGLHAIAASLDRDRFPLTASALRGIQPQGLARRLIERFPSDAIGHTLLAVSDELRTTSYAKSVMP